MTQDEKRKSTSEAVRGILEPIALPAPIKIAGLTIWLILLTILLLGLAITIIAAISQNLYFDKNTESELRFTLITITALTGVTGAVVALPITLRRSVQTERQTRTQEEGYVTQQINEAVANLAQEKERSQTWRTVTYSQNDKQIEETEAKDDRHSVPEGVKADYGDWQSEAVYTPNIEVRTGALLALERLARQRAEDAKDTERRSPDGVIDHDGARDHVRIMEILCTYIRENAPARSAAMHNLGEWPTAQENPDEKEREAYKKRVKDYRDQLSSWARSLAAPRTDIQTALRVLGRRTDLQIRCEGLLKKKKDQRPGNQWHGARLDLRNTNLQAADLAHSDARPLNLTHADLQGAQLQGAILEDAQLQGADLEDAQLQGADLRNAKLQEAILKNAKLQEAILKNAKLQGANLSRAELQGANLRGAQLKDADLKHAQFQGAELKEAELQGANLQYAQFQGADFWGADLTSTNWDSVKATASLVQFVDLRQAMGLTQIHLDGLIGNAATLLLEALEDGSEPLLYDRWETEPKGFAALIENLKRGIETEAEFRKAYLCEDGQTPRQVGIPLALGAEPPWGPLGANSFQAQEWVKSQEKDRS
ncbi:MAG: pentapeptide repeat-containing protein [Pseudomonadota bacterium]